MEKLILPVVITIILIGITFWIFNSPNGIGKGLDTGSTNVKAKIINATN
jgi:hypothetical protein